MATASIKQYIDDQLDQLPLEQQRRVLDFARSLATPKPQGTPGRLLTRFVGALSPEDAADISRAIEAGCESVEKDAW